MKFPGLGLPSLSLPSLEVPRLGLASLRRRMLVRAVFLLLALSTLAFAVLLLQEEKARSYANYAHNLRKTLAEVSARLRHPAGQLALLNPQAQANSRPLHPLLLPYAALDFDDRFKAQQAIETAGCKLEFDDGSSICVGIGSNPYAGGFVYLVGSFNATELAARSRGERDLTDVHRAQVELTQGGQTVRWVAPFELPEVGLPLPYTRTLAGRLTGFEQDDSNTLGNMRPVRDFRGWLWQANSCADPAAEASACLRPTFFSIRLPVDAYAAQLFAGGRPVWPPADLNQTGVRLRLLAPGGATEFDSNRPTAAPPVTLADLSRSLQPGETLSLRRLGPGQAKLLAQFQGEQPTDQPTLPWLRDLIGRLPAPTSTMQSLQVQDTLGTNLGRYELTLTGSTLSVDNSLNIVATRLSWYLLAMLGAIVLAWLIIEWGLLSPVKLLTRRAAAVAYNVNAPLVEQRLGALDVSDLRGKDELGILAGALADLLQRVKDDVKREHIRAEQERDTWHAVGHEIMSPLQSLMVLHPQDSDPSHRYVQRMQQAVRVLYGQASPREALQGAALDLSLLDLNSFLTTVAHNAPFAGIADVDYQPLAQPVMVRADEFSLEDVVTHILRNAQRHRRSGSRISLQLHADASSATLDIHNQGPTIAPELLETIFEYGVSGDATPSTAQRGQGLFVAKTYLAKMGGTVQAHNRADGVSFVLTLPLAQGKLS